MKTSTLTQRRGIIAALVFLSALSVLAQPVITVHPQTRTNIAGSTAIFSVEATGTPPLAYQWRSGNNNRPGATNDTLVLVNVRSTNQGFYSVIVSNVEGSVTSAVARLYVVFPPSITGQPSDRFVELGSTTILTATADGTAPLAYQWHLNESALEGKTNSSLSLIDVRLPDTGLYSVRVANLYGSVTSRWARLAIPPVRGFRQIAAVSNDAVSLHVTGNVASLYQSYFELFPVEASTNLLHWAPLTTLLRTNANTNEVISVDQRPEFDRRFFRIFPHHLYTPTVRPTGPYAVGTFSRLLNDPSRTNRYNVPTNSSFMVSYWYPANAEAGRIPGPWEDRPLAVDPNWWGIFTDRVPLFVAHSLPSAAIATQASHYPVIIYAQAHRGTRAENQEKFEELASHGYIVISWDSGQCYGTVFPDGTLRYSPPSTAGVASFVDRMADLRIILEDIERANLSDAVLAGRINLHNMGLFGWSFGAAQVAEMARTNNTCRAVLFLEGTLQGADQVQASGVGKPFLAMEARQGAGSLVFDKATRDAVVFTINGTMHSNYGYGYEVIAPSVANRELQVLMKAYILSFFNKYLKGQDDHLLDGPSTNFPRVTNFQKK